MCIRDSCKRFVTKSTRERAEPCVRSNVSREVARSEEFATVRTGHFGASYAIMHVSYVLCDVLWLKFSVASARTIDRRDVHTALVVMQRRCARTLLPTPLLITNKTTNNQFL
eukprot:TRINITY_DN1975_c0_g1_i4.p3 TRINITY_DN1975_c0_g1~~TRINITY_DN1975_c0_g1_i4.p3  ORF type:complete len:112 (-),score=1.01 TRINITY_DN1975_c0_g1_i4:52-387(-)